MMSTKVAFFCVRFVHVGVTHVAHSINTGEPSLNIKDSFLNQYFSYAGLLSKDSPIFGLNRSGCLY